MNVTNNILKLVLKYLNSQIFFSKEIVALLNRINTSFVPAVMTHKLNKHLHVTGPNHHVK